MAAITSAQATLLAKTMPRSKKLMSLIPGLKLAFTNFDATTGDLIASINDPNLTGVANSTFRVNTGAATPEIIIGGGSATGDYTLSLISPTLAADRVITFPAVTATLAILGANTFSAAQTFGAGILASGAVSNNFSGGTGTFLTSSGANTLSGDVTIAEGKDLTMSGTATLTTGTGAIALNGDITVAAGKDLVLADGTGYIYVGGATTGGIKILAVAGGTSDLTITNPSCASATTITLPNATATLSGLGLAETFSGVKTFTAAPAITIDDTNDTVIDLLTLTHSSSDDGAAAGGGVGIEFDLENDAATVEEWGRIDFVSADVTDGSEDVDIEVKGMLAGTSRAVLTMDASDEAWIIGSNTTDTDGINGLRIMPQTASKGSLLVRSTANDADYVVSITNAAHGQGSAYTIQDCGNATADIVTTYGNFTLNGNLEFASNVTVDDGALAMFGTNGDAAITWNTYDADAECLTIGLGNPAGNVVPVALFGASTGTLEVDHGFFNGTTQPTIALLDADADSYLKLDWSADDAARIVVGGAAAALAIGESSDTLTLNGVVQGDAEGYMTHTLVVDATVAEINAGHTLVTCPTGRQLQLVDVKAIAYGGAVGTVTTVDIIEETSGDKLVTFAQADLTQSAILSIEENGTVLADGASFTAQTQDKDIQVSKTGGAADTATGVRFIIQYLIV